MLVQRICASESLRRTSRVKDLLLFVTERALTNRLQELTEREIAQGLFGRTLDHVTNDDTIVRSTARQLRAKLREYFESEGRESAWVIEIPKGGYVPVFQETKTAAPLLIDPLPQPAVETRVISPWRTWAAWAIAALALVALAFQNYRQGQRLAALETEPSIVTQFKGKFVQPTTVVLGDYGFVLVQRILGEKMSLRQYTDRAYANGPNPPATDARLTALWSALSNRQVATYTEAAGAAQLMRMLAQAQGRVSLRHARNVTARDFKTGDHVLLGASLATPWVELFEEKLNFQWEVDPAGRRIGYRNQRPLPGELPWYGVADALTTSGPVYGRLAVVANLSGDGKVLLLGGINMIATEAIAEFASDPRSLTELVKALGASSLASVSSFEAILQMSSADLATSRSRIVAVRRHD